MPHHHETKVHTRIIPDHAEVVWNVSYPQGSTKTGKIVGFLPIQNVYIVKHDRVSFFICSFTECRRLFSSLTFSTYT